MSRKVFRFVVAFTLKHPMTICLIVGLITALSLAAVFYLQIETDITVLLPTKSPVYRTFEDALNTFKTFDFIIVVLEASEPGQGEFLIETAETLVPVLDNPYYIYSVDYKFDSRLKTFYLEGVEDRLSCLLSQSDLDAALSRFAPESLYDYIYRLARRLEGMSGSRMKQQILSDPLDLGHLFSRRLMISRGPIPFTLRRGYYLSRDEKMLLLVLRPLEPASDLKFSTELMGFMNKAVDVLIHDNPEYRDRVRVSFLGNHPETVANTRVVRNDLFQTLFTSFVGVILLFLAVFRRKEAIIFVGLPLFIGILWTLGLTQLFLGRLTMVTFAFGAVLIGLGIDFAIHIYNRFLEEIRIMPAPSVGRALNTALVKTGEGVLLGAITTAVAFFAMSFTSFRGFKELGIVAGSGILCCFVSIFLLLPLLIRYVSPRAPYRFRRQMTSFGLPRVYRMIMEHPRVVIILGLVVTVYFANQARYVRFEEDFGALKEHSRSEAFLRERVGERFSLPSHPIVAIVSNSNLQGVLEDNDRLYENLEQQDRYPILSCDTLRTFLPSLETQQKSKRMIRETIGEHFEKITERLEREAKRQNLSPMAMGPFIDRLKRLISSANRETFIRYENLEDPFMIQLVQQYLYKQDYFVKRSRQYKTVTRIFPPAGQWEAGVPRHFLETLREGIDSVQFTGSAIVASEIQAIVKRDLAYVILIVIFAILLILMLYFGWLHKTLFAIMPVVCGSIWMLGTIHILGMKLNFLNVVVVPMIIGVGVDNGIHLIQRFYENRKEPGRIDLQKAVEKTGRALVMTSLTTIVGFGSLALADFRGIREMGLLSIFGIAYTLIASVILMPALIKIWQPRHRLSDVIGQENGDIR